VAIPLIARVNGLGRRIPIHPAISLITRVRHLGRRFRLLSRADGQGRGRWMRIDADHPGPARPAWPAVFTGPR
jgi:hypothetical protein